ncbi:MAG: hypothetical protein ACOC1F_01780 [Myxococcota bacterium]
MNPKRACWALPVVILIFACGPEDDAPPHRAEATLAHTLARVYCDTGAACCRAAGLEADPDCVERQQTEYLRRIVAVRDAVGGGELDAQAVRRCVAEVKWVRGRCRFDIDPFVVSHDSICRDLYGGGETEASAREVDESVGMRVDGKDCSSDGQCASRECDGQLGMCLPDPLTKGGGAACGRPEECMSGDCVEREGGGWSCASVRVEAGMVNGRTCLGM